MKIAIAADHAGYQEKEQLKPLLNELGIQFEDLGTVSPESVDYPDYARKVAEKVARGEVDQGLLVCGSGTGMAIAANKVPVCVRPSPGTKRLPGLRVSTTMRMSCRSPDAACLLKNSPRLSAPGSRQSLKVAATRGASTRFARSNRTNSRIMRHTEKWQGRCGTRYRLILLLAVLVSGLPISISPQAQSPPEQRPTLKEFGSSVKRLKWDPVKQTAVETRSAEEKRLAAASEDVIRIDIELVVCDVLVLDGQGHTITGLTQEDFIVAEDGERQQISHFSLAAVRAK